MTDITAAMVKELRETTSAGMLDKYNNIKASLMRCLFFYNLK